MKPKEKALEITEKFALWFWKDGVCDYDSAKQCSLICVDELINDTDASSPWEENRLIYWDKVKFEIEKL